MGGRAVLKPSDEPARENRPHHRDYGLVRLEQTPSPPLVACCKEALREYVRGGRARQGGWRQVEQGNFAWASLQNFWCVKDRYLARQDTTYSSFNLVLGRKQDKSEKERKGKRIVRWSDLLEDPKDEVSRWLAGRRPGGEGDTGPASKKVLSFKSPQEGRRTFGFVKPDTVSFEEIKSRLKKVWQDFRPEEEFLTGEQILDDLCHQRGGSP
jgi:CRISPR-associated protein Cmr1